MLSFNSTLQHIRPICLDRSKRSECDGGDPQSDPEHGFSSLLAPAELPVADEEGTDLAYRRSESQHRLRVGIDQRTQIARVIVPGALERGNLPAQEPPQHRSSPLLKPITA